MFRFNNWFSLVLEIRVYYSAVVVACNQLGCSRNLSVTLQNLWVLQNQLENPWYRGSLHPDFSVPFTIIQSKLIISIFVNSHNGLIWPLCFVLWKVYRLQWGKSANNLIRWTTWMIWSRSRRCRSQLHSPVQPWRAATGRIQSNSFLTNVSMQPVSVRRCLQVAFRGFELLFFCTRMCCIGNGIQGMCLIVSLRDSLAATGLSAPRQVCPAQRQFSETT